MTFTRTQYFSTTLQAPMLQGKLLFWHQKSELNLACLSPLPKRPQVHSITPTKSPKYPTLRSTHSVTDDKAKEVSFPTRPLLQEALAPEDMCLRLLLTLPPRRTCRDGLFPKLEDLQMTDVPLTKIRLTTLVQALVHNRILRTKLHLLPTLELATVTPTADLACWQERCRVK